MEPRRSFKFNLLEGELGNRVRQKWEVEMLMIVVVVMLANLSGRPARYQALFLSFSPGNNPVRWSC